MLNLGSFLVKPKITDLAKLRRSGSRYHRTFADWEGRKGAGATGFRQFPCLFGGLPAGIALENSVKALTFCSGYLQGCSDAC